MYHNIFPIPNYTKSTAYTSCLGRWSSLPSCKNQSVPCDTNTACGRCGPYATCNACMWHASVNMWWACCAQAWQGAVVQCQHVCGQGHGAMCSQICTNVHPPPGVVQYGHNMRRTCASLSLPPSLTPCPPFRTFTLCLHPHISKREPVRAKLTS